MTEPGFHPPPPPSTPERAPWDEIRLILNRLDRLIAAVEGRPGVLAVELRPELEVALARRAAFPANLNQVLEAIQRHTRFAWDRDFRWLPFSKSIAALGEDKVERLIPWNSLAVMALFHFPDGPVTTAGVTLMDVRLLYIKGGVTSLVPSIDGEWVSHNDVILPFPINADAEMGGQFRVEWRNYDSSNAHTVPVHLLLLRKD